MDYTIEIKKDDLTKEEIYFILIKKFREILNKGALTLYSHLPENYISSFVELTDTFSENQVSNNDDRGSRWKINITPDQPGNEPKAPKISDYHYRPKLADYNFNVNTIKLVVVLKYLRNKVICPKEMKRILVGC